jgi:hypothetical protein
MKKSLVLAMAMALGVTASAYAANPFSDVPAGHWAYDSINKLAAAGVIEGYGDTTFGGDKLMTRYEMAQIVAKAMAKGANVDKLAAEFADELDNLGVRVANLEKKADNVKIAGEVRAHYVSHKRNDTESTSKLRSRLWVNGQINEDWTYTGMIENVQKFAHSNSGDEETEFRRAYVNGKLGGLAVQAGRWNEVVSTGSVLDSHLDGVKLSYGDKVKISGLAAKAVDECDIYMNDGKNGDRLYVASLEAKLGAVDAFANYFKSDIAKDKDIYNVGLSFDVAKDLNLAYEYMWASKKVEDKVSKDGFVATLAYKGSEPEEAGSYGLHVSYYDQPSNAFLAPTYDLEAFAEDGGYKGWNVGVDYTLAKNIQLVVNYYDTEAKTGNQKDQTLFSELYLYF